MSSNIAETILGQTEQDVAHIVRRAYVTGVSGNSVFLKRVDSATPDATAWPRCEASTWPLSVGDEVICLQVGGGGLVVLDRLIR